MAAFGRILELWRYPVSSLGGERLEVAPLDAAGVEGDRLWGLLDPASGEVAQPERRKRWRPAPNLSSRRSRSGVEIGTGTNGWLPAGSPAADEAASAHLGFPVVLRPHGAFGEEREGHVAPRYRRDHLHVVTTASLRRLAELLPETARVDVRRFRPNLVIETEPGFEGFVEADLMGRTLAVGAARIQVSEPCKRCAFTTLAQGELADGGLPLDPGVLQAITRAGGGNFGALCRVAVPGELRLGDPVSLLAPA